MTGSSTPCIGRMVLVERRYVDPDVNVTTIESIFFYTMIARTRRTLQKVTHQCAYEIVIFEQTLVCFYQPVFETSAAGMSLWLNRISRIRPANC